LRKDIALARANFHMTAAETAELALAANAGRLVLFHVSDRYDAEERAALLGEARAIFEKTAFPEDWSASE
jgi:ribonuclease Z